MDNDLIIVEEYCKQCEIEPSFIILLTEEGLIHTVQQGEHVYIPIAEVKSVDRFRRLYYDLEINMAGLDVIDNLLKRMDGMQRELHMLKRYYRLK
ncbi:MAG: chaperone modulator CbpM [Marinifilaceae bacterium]